MSFVPVSINWGSLNSEIKNFGSKVSKQIDRPDIRKAVYAELMTIFEMRGFNIKFFFPKFGSARIVNLDQGNPKGVLGAKWLRKMKFWIPFCERYRTFSFKARGAHFTDLEILRFYHRTGNLHSLSFPRNLREKMLLLFERNLVALLIPSKTFARSFV